MDVSLFVAMGDIERIRSLAIVEDAAFLAVMEEPDYVDTL
jgi:hypothetical protein